jgi:membrane protein
MEGLFSFVAVQIGAILLAAFVHASLQCELGSLLLLYHESLGKHIKKKTKRLASNYILGSAFLVSLLISTFAFFIMVILKSPLTTVYLTVIAAIMVALAIIIWFFYYKTKRSTRLWLPRSVANFINYRAKTTESSIEAFSLGMLTVLAEMPFSFVLILVAANALLLLPIPLIFTGIILYTAITILPLFILRFFVKRGSTIVDIQKWRVKNRNFLKTVSGTLFLTLAVFIIAYEVLGI